MLVNLSCDENPQSHDFCFFFGDPFVLMLNAGFPIKTPVLRDHFRPCEGMLLFLKEGRKHMLQRVSFFINRDVCVFCAMCVFVWFRCLQRDAMRCDAMDLHGGLIRVTSRP
jgi:hypothetical protein